MQLHENHSFIIFAIRFGSLSCRKYRLAHPRVQIWVCQNLGDMSPREWEYNHFSKTSPRPYDHTTSIRRWILVSSDQMTFIQSSAIVFITIRPLDHLFLKPSNRLVRYINSMNLLNNFSSLYDCANFFGRQSVGDLKTTLYYFDFMNESERYFIFCCHFSIENTIIYFFYHVLAHWRSYVCFYYNVTKKTINLKLIYILL